MSKHHCFLSNFVTTSLAGLEEANNLSMAVSAPNDQTILIRYSSVRLLPQSTHYFGYQHAKPRAAQGLPCCWPQLTDAVPLVIALSSHVRCSVLTTAVSPPLSLNLDNAIFNVYRRSYSFIHTNVDTSVLLQGPSFSLH